VLTLPLIAQILANFPPYCVKFFRNAQSITKKFALSDKKFAQNLHNSDSVNKLNNFTHYSDKEEKP
ncbi:MAG: hypothetical protein FWH20_09260, partial [Oscillospiraceae bacterium]|nr:hypothetical protein [Oscillospiraceae bacterium]